MLSTGKVIEKSIDISKEIINHINRGKYIKAVDLLFDNAEKLDRMDKKRCWKECLVFSKKLEYGSIFRKTVSEGIPFLLACRKIILEVGEDRAVTNNHRKILKKWLEKIDACASSIRTVLKISKARQAFIKPDKRLKAFMYAALALLDLKDDNKETFADNFINSINLMADISLSEIPFNVFVPDNLWGDRKNVIQNSFYLVQRTLAGSLTDKVKSETDLLRHIYLWLFGYDITVLRKKSVTIPYFGYGFGEGEISTLTVYLHNHGQGSIFPHPVLNSFCVYDDQFKSVLQTVQKYVNSDSQLKDVLRGKSVSWHVVKRAMNSSPVSSIDGPSWGVGFTLALISLLLDKNIDPDCCVTGAIDEKGRITGVGHIPAKLEAAKRLGTINTAIIPFDNYNADTQEGQDIRDWIKDGYYRKMKVEFASNIDEVAGIAGGLISSILNYFDSLEKTLNKLPSYYPHHYHFDHVRINIKVTGKRLREDEWKSQENQAYSQGNEYDYDNLYSVAHPLKEESMLGGIWEMEESEKNVIFEWDNEAGEKEKNRRLIILGDPGFGKTFLLKFEGLRILREARKNLENGERLSDIIIPVFIRLADIASYLFQKTDFGFQSNGTILQSSRTKNTHPVIEAVTESVSMTFDIGKSYSGRKIRENDIEGFKNFLRTKMETENCVLLLDALDEVPSDLRDGLREKIFDFSKKYSAPGVLLSSRIVGYYSDPPILMDKEKKCRGSGNNRLRQFAGGKIRQCLVRC